MKRDPRFKWADDLSYRRFSADRLSRSATKRAQAGLWYALGNGDIKDALGYLPRGYSFESMLRSAWHSPKVFHLMWEQYQPNPAQDEEVIKALVDYDKPSLLGVVLDYVDPSPSAVAYALHHARPPFLAKLLRRVDIVDMRFAAGMNALEVLLARPPETSSAAFLSHGDYLRAKAQATAALGEFLKENVVLLRKMMRAGMTIGQYASCSVAPDTLRAVLLEAGASGEILEQAATAAERDPEISRCAAKIAAKDASVYAETTSSQVAQRLVDMGIVPKSPTVKQVCRALDVAMAGKSVSRWLGADVAWWYSRATKTVRKTLGNPLYTILRQGGRDNDYGRDIIAAALASGLDPSQGGYHPRSYLPLAIAARWGLPDICKLLLVHGADVNAVNEEGSTPAHVALTYLDHKDDAAKYVAVLGHLVDHGADLGAQDKRGRTVEELTNTLKDAKKIEAVQEILNLRQRDTLHDLLAGMGIDRPKRAHGGL